MAPMDLALASEVTARLIGNGGWYKLLVRHGPVERACIRRGDLLNGCLADRAADMQLTLRQSATYVAHLHKAIFRSYHAQLVPYLTTIIPADGTVVDVGAHAGQFTKIFARLAPRGQVYAFEPSSYARSILSRVCTMKRLQNVTVVPAGLGAAAERLELNVPLKRSGSLGFGSSYLSPDQGRDGRARAIVTETIEVDTLDGFAEARGLDSLCFIKADIEGWELSMLQGATKVLSAFRPVLMLEIDDAHLQRAELSKAALFAFLGEHGYGWRRIEGYEGKSRGQIHLRNDRDDGNFFCFPVENLQASLLRLPTG
jgi:FkbM family methyltransferase